MLKQSDPTAAAHLLKEAKQDVLQQWKTYHALSMATPNGNSGATGIVAKQVFRSRKDKE